MLMAKYNSSLKTPGTDKDNQVKNEETDKKELQAVSKEPETNLDASLDVKKDTTEEVHNEASLPRTLEDVIFNHDKFLPPGHPVERTNKRHGLKSKSVKKVRTKPYNVIAKKWMTL